MKETLPFHNALHSCLKQHGPNLSTQTSTHLTNNIYTLTWRTVSWNLVPFSGRGQEALLCLIRSCLPFPHGLSGVLMFSFTAAISGFKLVIRKKSKSKSYSISQRKHYSMILKAQYLTQIRINIWNSMMSRIIPLWW